MGTILLVDDDKHVLKLLQIHLCSEGYEVLMAENGMEALDVLQNQSIDLAVIDVMMPFMDGLALTREIRSKWNFPVILLTAKGQLEDKEQGFISGTDDYVVKPFEPRELSFRIQALLRRYDQQPEDRYIHFGQMTINKNSYEIQIGERTLLLPLKEFELLAHLASHPKQVFTREQLIEVIWGIDYEGDERTVDVHIKRLRERFADMSDDFQIKTIRGVGYLLEGQKR